MESTTREAASLAFEGRRPKPASQSVAWETGSGTLDLAGIERGEAAPPESMRLGGLHAAPTWKLGLKRATDIALSLCLLLLTLPILLITALAVGISSRGSVFYVQERVGRGSGRFRMVKFRSMFADADERLPELSEQNQKSGPIFKLDNDPRVTRVGRVIRKLSIDELPQLLNVLRGDMSMVGPRPPLPREVDEYRPTDRQRLTVTPGLTCIWQVSGRSELDFDEWMAMDLEYIDSWSLVLDLRLMLRTVPAILIARGAY
jgi:lipopolysaccharide/colanic/teichoic acid biosynthesis glycosyltransferase